MGADADGDFLVREFQRFGVDTNLVRRVPCPCATAAVMVDDAGEKALVYAPIPGPVLDGTTLPAALGQARLVYAMPYDLAEFTTLSTLARAAGTTVAIDVEAAVAPTPAAFQALAPWADIVFFNERGFRAATGQPPGLDTLRAVLGGTGRPGPALAVVTLGARGALAATRDQTVEQPAFPTRLVDATGAGDCFNGACLAALLQGHSLTAALRFAAAAAGLAVTALGARSAIPGRQAVATLISRGPGPDPTA